MLMSKCHKKGKKISYLYDQYKNILSISTNITEGTKYFYPVRYGISKNVTENSTYE